jgi:hypothetical protein
MKKDNKYPYACCSCWMCGNPRKYMKGEAKFTYQELKQMPNLFDYIDFNDLNDIEEIERILYEASKKFSW